MTHEDIDSQIRNLNHCDEQGEPLYTGDSLALIHLLNELRAARETLAKLPKTADGVTVVPGMPVWDYGRSGYGYGITPGCHGQGAPIYTWNGWTTVGECYSTRSAAEAALAARSEGKQ